MPEVGCEADISTAPIEESALPPEILKAAVPLPAQLPPV